MPAVGIDFGTAKLKVAVVAADGSVEVLADKYGSRSTPSCVAIQGSQRLIGETARAAAAQDATVTALDNVKRVLGRTYHSVCEDDPPVVAGVRIECDPNLDAPRFVIKEEDRALATPEEVCSLLLAHLKCIAEDHVKEPVTQAVIAVPAFFNSAQRQATIDAARIAGLEVLSLINETSAVALAYAANKVEGERLAVIVDVGAGGGNVSLIKADDGGRVKVLATSGQRIPGGEDFNSKMIRHFAAVIWEQYKKNLYSEPAAQRALRAAWESAKLKLSEDETVGLNVYLPGLDVNFKMEINRMKFESNCWDIIFILNSALQEVLDDAQVPRKRVDDIVLVGGSSNLPVVESIMCDFFGGRERFGAVHRDEGVAVGAALHAAALLGSEQRLTLEEAMPLQLTVHSTSDIKYNWTFERNWTLPIKETVRITSRFSSHRAIILQVNQGGDSSFFSTISFVKVTSKSMFEESSFTINVARDGMVTFVPGLNVDLEVSPVATIGVDELQLLCDRVRRLQHNSLPLQATRSLEETCQQLLGRNINNFVRSLAQSTLNWLHTHQDLPVEEYEQRLAIIVQFAEKFGDGSIARAAPLSTGDAKVHPCVARQQPSDTNNGMASEGDGAKSPRLTNVMQPVARRCATPSSAAGVKGTPSSATGEKRTPSSAAGVKGSPSSATGEKSTPSSAAGVKGTPSSATGEKRTPPSAAGQSVTPLPRPLLHSTSGRASRRAHSLQPGGGVGGSESFSSAGSANNEEVGVDVSLHQINVRLPRSVDPDISPSPQSSVTDVSSSNEHSSLRSRSVSKERGKVWRSTSVECEKLRRRSLSVEPDDDVSSRERTLPRSLSAAEGREKVWLSPSVDHGKLQWRSPSVEVDESPSGHPSAPSRPSLSVNQRARDVWRSPSAECMNLRRPHSSMKNKETSFARTTKRDLSERPQEIKLESSDSFKNGASQLVPSAEEVTGVDLNGAVAQTNIILANPSFTTLSSTLKSNVMDESENHLESGKPNSLEDGGPEASQVDVSGLQVNAQRSIQSISLRSESSFASESDLGTVLRVTQPSVDAEVSQSCLKNTVTVSIECEKADSLRVRNSQASPPKCENTVSRPLPVENCFALEDITSPPVTDNSRQARSLEVNDVTYSVSGRSSSADSLEWEDAVSHPLPADTNCPALQDVASPPVKSKSSTTSSLEWEDAVPPHRNSRARSLFCVESEENNNDTKNPLQLHIGISVKEEPEVLHAPPGASNKLAASSQVDELDCVPSSPMGCLTSPLVPVLSEVYDVDSDNPMFTSTPLTTDVAVAWPVENSPSSSTITPDLDGFVKPTTLMEVTDQQIVEIIMGRLQYHVLSRDCPCAARNPLLSLSVKNFCNPELAGRLVERQQEVLECMAEATVRSVMAEVRDAGAVCLMLDAVPTRESGELVSMMLRYCLANGDIVERLIALRDARTTSGAALFERFASLCDANGVDWPRALVAVAMDAAGAAARTAYDELLTLLKERAPRGARVVWNASSHNVEELVTQAWEVSVAGREFCGTMACLRDFFNLTSRARRLLDAAVAKPGVEQIVASLVSQDKANRGTLIDWMAFLLDYSPVLMEALIALKQESDCTTAFLAGRLQSAIVETEFATVLVFGHEVLRELQPLSRGLAFNSMKCKSSKVVKKVLKLLEGFENDRFLEVTITKAEARGLLPQCATETRTYLLGVLRRLSRATLETLTPRLQNSRGAMRDIDILCLALTDFDHYIERFFTSVSDLNREVLMDELNRGKESILKVPADGYASPEAVLNGMIHKLSRRFYKTVYPQLYAGLLELCTTPLLRSRADKGRLLLLRTKLRDSCVKQHPALEASMILTCAADTVRYYQLFDVEEALQILGGKGNLLQ